MARPGKPAPRQPASATAGASANGPPTAGIYTTVRKALMVISAFSYAEPVLGVSELARRLHLGKSTVHRILATLALEGFVERTSDDRYRLSLKLYDIGLQVASSNDLRQVAHPYLERLRNESGETAHLAVLDGTDVVYLDRLESPHMLRLMTKVGRRRAAHATSSGKCLLAFGISSGVETVINSGLGRLGPRTITTGSVLRRALSDVRKKGYAVCVEESAPGVVSLGAPVFGPDGTCVAAVSVAGPQNRIPPESFDRLARMVVIAAADISRSFARRQPFG